MHCEACAQEIKNRIQKMKGVESVEPDLKNSTVTVKGTFDRTKLVERVHNRTGKHVTIVTAEPEKKESGEDPAPAPAPEKEGEESTTVGGEVKEATEEIKMAEMRKNDFFYNYYAPARHGVEVYAYPPHIFSDENPNACTVM